MPIFSDASGNQTGGDSAETLFGLPPAPPGQPAAPPTVPQAPTAVPTTPTVSQTPNAGVGVALDANGRLPVSVNSTITGFEIAYVELSTGGSTLNITGTTSAAPTSVVAAPTMVFDGQTTVIVSFFVQAFQKGTTSIFIGLYDGTTLICPIAYSEQGWAPGGTFQRRLTPSQGEHTYGIKAWVDAGTGILGSGSGSAGSNSPAFIQIKRA